MGLVVHTHLMLGLLAGAELFLSYGTSFWEYQKQWAVHIQEDKAAEVSMQSYIITSDHKLYCILTRLFAQVFLLLSCF